MTPPKNRTPRTARLVLVRQPARGRSTTLRIQSLESREQPQSLLAVAEADSLSLAGLLPDPLAVDLSPLRPAVPAADDEVAVSGGRGVGPAGGVTSLSGVTSPTGPAETGASPSGAAAPAEAPANPITGPFDPFAFGQDLGRPVGPSPRVRGDPARNRRPGGNATGPAAGGSPATGGAWRERAPPNPRPRPRR